MDKIFNKVNSFSDIVQTMVEGVRKEWVRVDMNSFGRVGTVKKFFGLITKEVCYGCAATNTLCELMGEPFTLDSVYGIEARVSHINHGLEENTLKDFESAIDYLRMGSLKAAIRSLKRIESNLGFEVPEEEVIEDLAPYFLPYMEGKNLEELKIYEDFAKNLREAGY